MLPGALGLTVLMFSNLLMPFAFAHQTVNLGGFNMEVGWASEPSYAGQLNTVIVRITNASDNSPVPNAVEELQTTIKKGSETKTLDLVPQEEEGLYGAQVIPGQIGQYELVLNGAVSGQSVNGTLPLDDVADPKQLTFPSTTSSDSQITSGIMDQISGAITDLSTQVENAQTSADQAQQTAQNVSQSAQSIKASADGAYMFATIGVGIGIAGIALAVIALSRRERVEGERIRKY
jgi:phosphotransferase system  glucose/maltose/N-acetylglucosamine-specific IIC component